MLVRVSQKYAGMYGAYNEDIKSVIIKTRESAPFEEDDALSLRMIEKGILVRADADEAEAEPEESTEEISEELPAEDEEADLESLSMKELKEIASEYGISYKVGMSKADLINAINESESEEPPTMAAADPE
jgi:hypothetical protein